MSFLTMGIRGLALQIRQHKGGKSVYVEDYDVACALVVLERGLPMNYKSENL